jgi:hypothetical protein
MFADGEFIVRTRKKRSMRVHELNARPFLQCRFW